MEGKIVYFGKSDKDNIDEVLRIAKQRADELDIKTAVVASATGYTAVKAMQVFDGMRVIVVTRSVGYKEANLQEFTEENRKIVESKGGIILTTAHAFGGLSRTMRQSTVPQAQQTYIIQTYGDLIANSLRIFGQGVKVACEIATMAADAGLVRTDEDIISIGGTGGSNRGEDAALVLRPAYSHVFFETQVKEILCKPRFSVAVAPQRQEVAAAGHHHH